RVVRLVLPDAHRRSALALGVVEARLVPELDVDRSGRRPAVGRMRHRMAPTEHRFIEMDDGVRLAATTYHPDGDGPHPALLEALPYRKDDLTGTSTYLEEYHRFADEFGYAVCRLDVRGTGSSEGVPRDEYTPRELDDIALVIAWL